MAAVKLTPLNDEYRRMSARANLMEADMSVPNQVGWKKTAVRDTGWHCRGIYGALHLASQDAENFGCIDGDLLRLSTHRASIEVQVEVSPMMQPGHISLPNGQGLDYQAVDGCVIRKGVAPNELTDSRQRDFFAGTPWHKHVPSRLEKISLTGGTEVCS